MKKRTSWGRQLFFAIVLTIICISYLVSNHGRVGAEFFLFVVLAAHSWYLVIKFWPKSWFLDAIHDTVHEMARDEVRHGVALKGLLERYFK